MRKAVLALLMLALSSLLLACQGQVRAVVVEEGAADTQVAATAFYVAETETAVAQATQAVQPTPEPTVTSTPYIRPTDDPAVDPDTVIATVAGHDITVQEFRNRVRYERWAVLTTLKRVADTVGLDALDIRDPNNTMSPTIMGYLYTLSNTEKFAQDVLNFMIQERVIHQEFVDRGMELQASAINNLWARLAGVELTQDGVLPDDFDAQLESFMDALNAYTDITEVELRFLITVRSEEERLAEVVGQGAEIPVEALDVRHILLATEEEAQEVVQLLEDGADFNELARERSLDGNARGKGGVLGRIAHNDTVLPFEEAAFAAPIGEVVGPVETQFGYHLIVVDNVEEERASRTILLETEAEAEAALARLQDGEDFDSLALELSLDPDVAENHGDIGYITEDDDRVPEAYRDAVFNAEVGDVIGPVQTAFGYHIIEVTDSRRVAVYPRHILVETEDEALDILARLDAGEDFSELANELSIDPGTQGNGGELGLLTEEDLPPELFAALDNAEENEIVGPIQTDLGWHVAQVTDRQLNYFTPEQLEEQRAVFFQNWLRREMNQVAINEVWREVYPQDPRPGDLAPYLADLENAMNEALAAFTPVPEATSPPTE